MCGIFGEFGKLISSDQEFQVLNDLNIRRGPDDSGYWSDDSVCKFGFRRLSIIDLSERGNQPMHSMNDKWVMVMNGEVYNYKELHAELGNPILKSNSDSEVVINVFEKYGIVEGARKLNGMYAIAIFNKEEKILYLIRDFAGVKPLYYSSVDGTIVFGSSYSQIFQHPSLNNQLEVNPRALSDYLMLGYVPAPGAFFKNTFQVLPGEIVSFQTDGRMEKFIYYSLEKDASKYRETTNDAKHKVDACLDSAVKRQLVSDVPLGTFLSGGVDSPLVNAYAIKHKADIASFTIGSKNAGIDESEYAEAYARHLKIKNFHEYYTSSNLLEQVEEHFKAYSEPFADYSSLPTYMVSMMAKEHFTVMLSGDGGDELFWGYPRFLKYIKHLHWFDKPHIMSKWQAAFSRRIRNKFISGGIHQPTLGHWVMLGQSHNFTDKILQFFPGFGLSDETLRMYTFDSRGKKKEEVLQWLRRNEFYGHLQRVLLKVDRASMYHSLEVRVPFLDKEVLEISGEIIPELGINHDEPKYILKELMKDNFPEEMINREKMGFAIEITQWLRHELKADVLNFFNADDVYPRNTFNMPALRIYVNDFMDGKTNNGWGIWILYALQKWARQYNLKL